MSKFLVGDLVQVKESMWKGIDLSKYSLVPGRRYAVSSCTDSHYPSITLMGLPSLFDSGHFELATIKPKRYFVGDKVISTRDTPSIPEGFVGYVVQKPSNSCNDYEYAVQHESSIGVIEYFNEDELELLSASSIQDIKGVVSNSDPVNSPKHYAVFDDIEAIEIIARSMTKEMFKGYCFGNLLKYRLRAGGKDDVDQELGKAEKYKELYEKYKELCQ